MNQAITNCVNWRVVQIRLPYAIYFWAYNSIHWIILCHFQVDLATLRAEWRSKHAKTRTDESMEVDIEGEDSSEGEEPASKREHQSNLVSTDDNPRKTSPMLFPPLPPELLEKTEKKFELNQKSCDKPKLQLPNKRRSSFSIDSLLSTVVQQKKIGE